MSRFFGLFPGGPSSAKSPPAQNTALSYVRFTGFAGFGSSNNRVFRWTTQEELSGLDIQPVQSAANGDSFLIAKNGIYTIDKSIYPGAAVDVFIHVGIAIVNTVAYDAITIKRPKIFHAGYLDGMSWTGPISAGKVIFTTAGAVPNNTYPLMNAITISRVG